MKIILTLITLMSYCQLVYSQVGIGNNVNTFDDSEILKIESSNKGVLLPNISIPDLNEPEPVTNPENSLFVYNTNTTTGTGFYMWKDNKWNPLINSTNVYKYLGIVSSYTAISNNGVNDSTPNGAVGYTVGEVAADHDWQLIPNLTQTFPVYSANNNVAINVGGIVQANSVSGATSTHSYAVAVFIDDKLASVRNFIVSGNADCLYNDFNIFMTINNLSVANHTVKVYQTYRVNLTSTTGAYLRFGERISSCSNLSNDMSRTILNVQVSEKP